jgi:hypothetical protein
MIKYIAHICMIKRAVFSKEESLPPPRAHIRAAAGSNTFSPSGKALNRRSLILPAPISLQMMIINIAESIFYLSARITFI